MNAPVSNLAPAPPAGAGIAPRMLAQASAVPPAQRADGWTSARRRTFLALVADGATVEAACARVGLSVASAYALRRRPNGAAFAAGWAAAALVARDRLADVLMARALEGQVDTYTRADGTVVTRHRHDNRLAMAMLTRLDRLAETHAVDTGAAPETAPARVIAADFDAFLDLVEGEEADATAVAAFVTARNPQLPQLRACAGDADGDEADEDDDDEEGSEDPVWFDVDEEMWLTSFPPPPGFEGDEYGDYGEEDYARELTRDEMKAHRAALSAETERLRAVEGAERDAWFGLAGAADAASPPASASSAVAGPLDAADPTGIADDDPELARWGGNRVGLAAVRAHEARVAAAMGRGGGASW